jgi:hypothetical protein
MKALLTTLAVLLSVGMMGCDQLDAHGSQHGAQHDEYKVISSEAFMHRYWINSRPGLASCIDVDKNTCEMPETRFVFSHNGVNTVTECQSWDATNDCSLLRVGTSYKCEHNDHPQQYGNMLRCDLKRDTSWGASLDIKKEEVAK